MKTQIPSRDLQLLSEYLDGQITPGEQARLEARLQKQPELQDALDDLRQTRALLRSVPRLKAPRSFKLTPEMVGQRPARRVYPMFQLASALASLLLVLVLVGDFLSFSRQMDQPAQAPVNLAMEVQEEKFYPEPESQAYESAPIAGSEETDMAATATVEAEIAGAAADEAGDAARSMTEPTVMALNAPEAGTVSEEQNVEGTGAGFSSWRILETVLLLIAIAAGITALYLRRLGD